MKIVYIAHPISGNVQDNLNSIIRIVRKLNLSDPEILPFCHYWVECHALNDNNPVERERGIKNDHYFLKSGIIQEVWLFGPTISNGMLNEIATAHKLKIPVIPKTPHLKNLYKSMFN